MTNESQTAELMPVETDNQSTEIIEADAVQAPAKVAPSAIQVGSAFDLNPKSFAAGLKRRDKNRKALMEWIRDGLKEGRDWGRIHVVKRDRCDKGQYCENPYHFSKPSLWKSGAESICGMLGLRVTWPNLESAMRRVEDGKAEIILKCNLMASDGATISEGIGARNLAQDAGDLNKALKMAKKSGLIDAVLNLGLSEIFTQDIDDMDPEQLGEVGDPYNARQERGDSFFDEINKPGKPVATHCPMGKHKGEPWEQVPDDYLNWIVSKIDDKPEVVAAARKELDGRSLESQEQTADRKTVLHDKPLGEYVQEIGKAKTAEELARIRKEMPDEFLASVRAFLAKREVELRDQHNRA